MSIPNNQKAANRAEGADQSGIPHDQLVLVDGEANYAHNDPAGASPNNEFLQNLTPFLNKIG